MDTGATTTTLINALRRMRSRGFTICEGLELSTQPEEERMAWARSAACDLLGLEEGLDSAHADELGRCLLEVAMTTAVQGKWKASAGGHQVVQASM